MHRTAFLLSFALLACGGSEPVVTETMDTRAPVAVMYVGAPEVNVREQPNDTAAVVATYQNGEALSDVEGRARPGLAKCHPGMRLEGSRGGPYLFMYARPNCAMGVWRGDPAFAASYSAASGAGRKGPHRHHR